MCSCVLNLEGSRSLCSNCTQQTAEAPAQIHHEEFLNFDKMKYNIQLNLCDIINDTTNTTFSSDEQLIVTLFVIESE